MQPGQDDPYQQQPPGSYPPPGANPSGSYPPQGSPTPGSYPPPGGYPQPGSYPPPQYGPGQPPYPGGPQNTQGLVAMILGIAAIPLLCCFSLGLPLGIAAAILGYLGLNKAKAGLATNRGQALTGLICGAAAVVLGIAGLLYAIFAGTWNFSSYNNFS
jgi:hypothetical protein